ncbi:hypothetical protein F66182_3864 [Fusarium sp. NRRL 66182]|nr:hypothetical protein F66182_3864 [Fusarium sp. NRRL 66182]
MLAKTVMFLAAAALMQQVAAQNAQVCTEANLGGECEDIGGDNSCRNLIRADAASSYRTNGLTCTFYDGNNCAGAIISDVNGEQPSLRNTAFNDNINSGLEL